MLYTSICFHLSQFYSVLYLFCILMLNFILMFCKLLGIIPRLVEYTFYK